MVSALDPKMGKILASDLCIYDAILVDGMLASNGLYEYHPTGLYVSRQNPRTVLYYTRDRLSGKLQLKITKNRRIAKGTVFAGQLLVQGNLDGIEVTGPKNGALLAKGSISSVKVRFYKRSTGGTLTHFGRTPPTKLRPLRECEGDCDRDTHCAPGLRCFHRKGKEKVPGCKLGGAGDKSGHDYCYKPLTSKQAKNTISFVGPLTDDASTGISSDNEYTHTISGGTAASVNGVDFEVLDANTTPNNFLWDVSSTKQHLDYFDGHWDVEAGGVTGSGLKALLVPFTYNLNGAVGSNQTFTLSGLTPGQYYELRLFCRKWVNDSERQQTVEFSTGETIDTVTFSEDRPEVAPINMKSRDEAYYLSYRYTAGNERLIVKFTVASPGSFHMYGLTNQKVLLPS